MFFVREMHKVRVELGAASYDIFIGENLLPEISDFVKAQNFSHKALVISDENVGKIYGER